MYCTAGRTDQNRNPESRILYLNAQFILVEIYKPTPSVTISGTLTVQKKKK